MDTITIIYMICAIGGGTLLLCQFVMSLLGMGDHHDVGADHHDVGADHHDVHHGDAHDAQGYGSWFVGVLTFRSVVAALTFFGLGGMAATVNANLDPGLSFGLALAAGVAALFAVAYLMRFLHQLKSDGTVRIDRAIGKSGTVYLSIPGQKAGVGKITLNLQNRSVEYQAVTPHPDQLPTGSKIVVTAIVGPDTVEVTPAS